VKKKKKKKKKKNKQQKANYHRAFVIKGPNPFKKVGRLFTGVPRKKINTGNPPKAVKYGAFALTQDKPISSFFPCLHH